jgi:hypothetical protein
MMMSKAAVVQWFQQQPREVFTEWIHQLVHQWEAYFGMHGTIANSLYLNKPHTSSKPEDNFTQNSHEQYRYVK